MASGRLESLTYNALRIVAGLLFTFHGLSKFGMFGGTAGDLMTRRGLAAVIEAVGGPLIMVGLFTVPTAFIASGEMAFAYFLSHHPRGFWPIQNGGEPAVLFCFIFLFVSVRGPGSLSLDAILRRKK
jgi:putative oxidoreductase